jgi:hypothetical protein
MYRAVKTRSHHLRDAARIIAVRLVDLSLQQPEPNPETKKKDVVWFALADDRPLTAFSSMGYLQVFWITIGAKAANADCHVGMYCRARLVTVQRPAADKYRVRRTEWGWENKPRRLTPR